MLTEQINFNAPNEQAARRISCFKTAVKSAIVFFVFLLCSLFSAAADDYEFGDFLAKGPSLGGKIALTFDDGPGKSTKELLDVLDKHKAKATFFMLGDSVRYHKAYAKLVSEKGHLVANHTYAHKNFRPLGNKEKDAGLTEEILKAQDIIYKNTGEMPVFLRMPYGFMRKAATNAAKETGYILVNWTYGMDWNQMPREILLKMYTDNMHAGAIFLFHDGGAAKTETVVWLTDKIIEEAHKRGLKVVRLDELLNIDSEKLTESKAKLALYGCTSKETCTFKIKNLKSAEDKTQLPKEESASKEPLSLKIEEADDKLPQAKTK